MNMMYFKLDRSFYNIFYTKYKNIKKFIYLSSNYSINNFFSFISYIFFIPIDFHNIKKFISSFFFVQIHINVTKLIRN